MSSSTTKNSILNLVFKLREFAGRIVVLFEWFPPEADQPLAEALFKLV